MLWCQSTVSKYENVQCLHTKINIIFQSLLCGGGTCEIGKCFMVLCRIILSFRPVSCTFVCIDSINWQNVVIILLYCDPDILIPFQVMDCGGLNCSIESFSQSDIF